MTVPRILVIDDQCATQPLVRANVFQHCDLKKIELETSEAEVENIAGPRSVAAVFTSGQIRRGAMTDNSIEEVLRVVKAGWPSVEGWRWALILLDLQFLSTYKTDQDLHFGIEILKELVQTFPDREARAGNSELPIVMLSTEARETNEIRAGKYGASAYIEKPELTAEVLERLLDHHGLVEDPNHFLLGKSYGLLKILREARRIARMNNGNALILGPQGAGKTSIARYIHRQSRRDGELIEHTSKPAVKELEYSALFGCWKGAHNEAKASSGGTVEQAHRGTLLIDEVHTLNAMNQEELLQFGRLNEGKREVRRLGNANNDPRAEQSVNGEFDKRTSVITVDVLLLAATNEPLDDPEWRSKYGFKGPLYTRLALEYAGKPLRFPSLAERRDDIPLLFEKLVNLETKKIEGRTNENENKLIDPAIMQRLKDYSWPGNVAQLYGIARTAARNAQEFPEVFERHLPPLREDKLSPIPLPPVPPEPTPIGFDELEQILRTIEVPTSRHKLNGRLQSLQDAYGRLIKEMFEVALEQTQPVVAVAPEKRPYIPALQLLYGYRMAAYQGNGKLLKINKMFWKDNPPAEGSPLAIAVERARKHRHPNGVDDEDNE